MKATVNMNGKHWVTYEGPDAQKMAESYVEMQKTKRKGGKENAANPKQEDMSFAANQSWTITNG